MQVNKGVGLASLKSEAGKKINKMNIVKDFYGGLSKQIIKDLYSVYKMDFEMLQYEHPQAYIDMGS